MPFVVGNIIRHIILRTDQNRINKRNTGNPVTIQHLAISLNIVLPTGEIPHEVTPIHEIHLIAEEETQVFPKSRFHGSLRLPTIIITHRFPLHLCPLLIGFDVARVTAVHTREKHIQLIHILILLIIAGDIIPVFLFRVFLDYPAPCRFALLGDRDAISALILALHFRNVGLSIQQRRLPILLTRQISAQRENIARCILVHRRVCRCPNQGQGV